MEARPTGFELSFTKPVDPVAAADAANYTVASFTYERWEKYGSPEIDRAEHRIRRAVVASDGRSVHLTVEGFRAGYVYELAIDEVPGADGETLLHPNAYYTLNVIPRTP